MYVYRVHFIGANHCLKFHKYVHINTYIYMQNTVQPTAGLGVFVAFPCISLKFLNQWRWLFVINSPLAGEILIIFMAHWTWVTYHSKKMVAQRYRELLLPFPFNAPKYGNYTTIMNENQNNWLPDSERMMKKKANKIGEKFHGIFVDDSILLCDHSFVG